MYTISGERGDLMKDWTKEEIQFVKEYYADYPIKEIATELKRSITSVNEKAKELGMVEIIPVGFKKCIDCNTIKPITDFHAHLTCKDGANSYCKACDSIRRRNNTILKKKKEKLTSATEKLKLAEQLKLKTESLLYECKSCGQQKIGKEFYFDSNCLKRMDNCKLCYLKKSKERELKKILERGY